MPALRHVLLGLGLLSTIVVSFVDLPQSGVVAPESAASATAPGPRSTRVPRPPSPGTPETPRPVATRAPYAPSDNNLFAARNWQPPPVAEAPAAPASVPVAPPLPFRYLGKLLDDGEVMAFVTQDARTHLLRRGDVVADYKVVDITTERMTLVYGPLKQTQYLPFGSAH